MEDRDGERVGTLRPVKDSKDLEIKEGDFLLKTY